MAFLRFLAAIFFFGLAMLVMAVYRGSQRSYGQTTPNPLLGTVILSTLFIGMGLAVLP